MRNAVRAAAMLIAVTWSVCHSAPALAQRPPGMSPSAWDPLKSDLRNPQIEIVYEEPKNPNLRPIYERLKKRQVLEELRAFLAPLRLPKPVRVRTAECGATTSPYQPDGPVTICYDYIALMESRAPEDWVPIGGYSFLRSYAITGAFVSEALHEFALAAFDLLEIPVWGGDQHAADRVAALVMLQFGGPTAYKTLMGTAWFLAQTSVTGIGEFSTTMGEDLQVQRFYNYLCVAYGADPQFFSFLKATLEKRRQSCGFEYDQILRAFSDTFMPYVDRDLMKKVQAIEWLRPDDGK
jgi:Putative metallopeptidase